MPLIFAVGLPIGLAKQAQGRACLAVMVSFLTWNYFINAMGMTWGSYFGVDFTQDAVAGSGLTMMAGIKTLDTSIIGAIIISGIVTALHNRLFDKKTAGFSRHFPGNVLCGDYRLPGDDPLCLADIARLAKSTNGD